MPISNIKAEIARVLKEEGFIESYELSMAKKSFEHVLRIRLKYVGERRQRQPVITGIERVSRPGRRVYTRKQEIPWFLSGWELRSCPPPRAS